MTHHILVVEDEAKLAKFIELELQYEGYQVSVAQDGFAGLATARESQPDLLILDWMLPVHFNLAAIPWLTQVQE